MKQLFLNFLAKPERVFLVISGFFGLLSVFMMPILQVPDENQHFQVAYAIFSKNGHASKDLVLNEAIVLGYSEQGYGTFFSERTDAAHDGIDINTDAMVFDGKTPASVFDLMRLPQALGVLLGRLVHPSIGSMVTFGRILNLLVFLVATYFIIKKVRYGKWIFLFIACLPIAVQQASSLSYDSTNSVIIFAWVAFMINLFTHDGPLLKKHVFIATVLAAFLFISKSNNLLLLGLMFALPTELLTKTDVVVRLRKKKYWKLLRNISIGIITIGIVVALYVLSQKVMFGNELDAKRLGGVLLNTFIRGDSLALIDAVTIGMIGFFSVFYYHLPVWVVVIAFCIILIGMLHEKLPHVTKRFAAISALLFFGSILLISIGMYYGWAIQPFRLGPDAKVADGIQGRYFTPLLVLLFPVFSYLQKFIRITPNSKNTVPILVSATSAILLVLYIYQTWHFFWA